MSLSDRMKSYEKIETSSTFNNDYLIARVDGRSFSKFTKKLIKPYDLKFSNVMSETTKYVLNNTNSDIAYQQSDEATFVFKPTKDNSERFFKGKKSKLISIISAMFSSKFLIELSKQYPEIFEYASGYVPHFDCRVFTVPSEAEAVNCLLWRVQDAKRNSVSMVAQHYFSHKELQGKNSTQMKEMLKDISNYDYYPNNFKFGTFYKKVLTEKILNNEKCMRTEIVSDNFDNFNEIKDFFND